MLRFLIYMAIVVCLVCCETSNAGIDDNVSPNDSISPTDTSITDTITKDPGDTLVFSIHIAPFLEHTCAICHHAGRTDPDLTSGNSYEQIINGNYVIVGQADESLLVQQAQNNHSLSPLNNSELKLLKAWINFGAKE